MPSRKFVLKTYLTPEEHEAIRASASKAGLSLSTFSKRVCLGFSVPSLEQPEARIELRRLKGDLGRLGGAGETGIGKWRGQADSSPSFT